nr:hypothetical protein [Tanacetum cinerariifolium]
MSTQQDIYAARSESRPPMLNKENYVPWSSSLLRYAKSRPNGKLIHNSIINGPYVRRMIPEPSDTNCEVPTDDELTEKELKQIEADDQAIQTILLGLHEDIYAAVDSYETAQEIWLRVQQMMKGSNIRIQEKKANQNGKEVDELKAKRLVKTQDPLALMATSNNPYTFPAPHQDQPSFNQNYMQQPMLNPEDITDPTTTMNMELALMAKAFKLNYSTPTNNNQRISSNPRNGNQNLNENGNLVAAHAEGNAAGHNRNQIRCYNCRGEEAGIQLQAEEFDLMAAVVDLDEIKEVNENYILMDNLQEASTSVTQTDKAPVYDSDGSAKIKADDQAIQTILLGLHEDIYAAVDSYETAQEIWLRVQQMMKGSDIGIQEKKAKQMQIVGGNGGNQFRQCAMQNVGNLNRNGNYNLNENGNLVAARAEGNAAGHNGNQIRKHRHRLLRLTKPPSMTQTGQLRTEVAKCLKFKLKRVFKGQGTRIDNCSKIKYKGVLNTRGCYSELTRGSNQGMVLSIKGQDQTVKEFSRLGLGCK